MATAAHEWPEPGDEHYTHRPEPVITYNHMSDTEQFAYFSNRDKNHSIPVNRLVLDSLLIAGMIITLLILSL